MNRLRIASWLAVVTLAPPARGGAQTSPAKPVAGPSVNIPFEKFTLANGLSVVLAVDHTTPTVAVAVSYHVGSKNEVVGRTGFAHMFEHVMFTGSGHVPYGMHDRFTEGVGGANNGTTNSDRTLYYETDPSNYLETALWLEADRMGFLLDSLDEAKFKAQRDIVQNERRQYLDNQPNGRDDEVIQLHMYPKTNPYSWPTIGGMVDLKAATVEDVKSFFRLYYAPNNATLSIAGDFDAARAKALVAKYFTDLPRGKTITRPVVGRPAITAERRMTFEDHVQVPRLTIAWPTVSAGDADQPALDLLSDILGSGRTSRLTKALVYDKELATDVGVYQSPYEATGRFEMQLTPRPGHSLTELESEADAIVATLKREGPTAEELKRVKAGQEASFIDGLQSNLGKAIQLAEAQTFFNDPSYYFRVRYPREQAVTAADIKRVANKYLTKARIVLSNVPVGKTELASHADRSTVVTDPLTDKSETTP